MREAGATRQEIRDAVAEMLEEFGVELPEGRGPGGCGRNARIRQGIIFSGTNPVADIADLAVIDTEIQMAPAAPASTPITTWGRIRASR